MLHGDDHFLGTAQQVHRTAHSWHHFARYHVVGNIAIFGNLQGSQHGHVHMPTADNAKGHGAIKETSTWQDGHRHRAGIGNTGIDLVFGGNWTHTDEAIFGLEGDVSAFRDKIRDQGRKSDAEVYERAILELLGNAFGNEFLHLLFVHHCAPPSTM